MTKSTRFRGRYYDLYMFVVDYIEFPIFGTLRIV